MIRLADYVMQRLEELNITKIFTVNGRGVLYLTDALARSEKIQAMCMHNEQAVSYACMSNAMIKNDYAACLVSTGCAATNSITGVLCAWQDSLPCIFISGNNMLNETSRYCNLDLRTWGQQENDIIPLVEPITKYAAMVTNPEDIAFHIEQAIYYAKEGRFGPVWLDIPLDIQNARIDEKNLKHFCPEATIRKREETEKRNKIQTLIEKADRPTVLIGSGIRSANAQDELKIFVEKNHIPIVYATSAPDVMNDACNNVIGCVSSMGGSRAGNFALQNSDLLLVLGNRLSPMTTSAEYKKFARNADVVVVDIDEAEHTKATVKIDVFLCEDVRRFLQKINEKTYGDKSAWLKQCIHWKEIFPICEERYREQNEVDIYQLAEAMTEAMPEYATLITDAGLLEVILPTNIRFKKQQRLIHPNSQGAMGFALPAAVGVSGERNNESDLEEQIIVATGDGSAMFNIQELATISYHNINAKILIHNNNGYATIRRRQQELFRNRTLGNDATDGISLADYEKIANAFNIPYVQIEDNKNLAQKLKTVFKMQGPVLCEITGKQNQGYLHSSYTRNKDKKIVKRPLEDQSPFLDRDLFLKEMVIEPIDQ